MAMPHPQRAQVPGDLTGATVGRFRVESLVGAGGMGEVYCAEDSALRRRVALKRIAPALRSDAHVVHQFRREAQRASALSHPSIAAIYDILEDKGEVLLVLEYIEGETLRPRCKAPMPVSEALRILRQCAEALAAAHEKQVVHLDLKPENIMLTPEGQVKVLDFGVAHRLGVAEASASTDSLLALGGTMAYMAPEQLLGHAVDARADIFALGIVAYELLAGRHPFRGENWGETLDHTLHTEPAPLRERNPAVWPQLEKIIQRMLAKDPNARYASARELLHDLQLLEREGSAVTAIVVPAVRPAKRRTWLLVASGVALLLVAVLLLVGRDWMRKRRDQPLMPASKNLAVLPFRVIGGKPELQSYSDGLTETVTARLTQITAPETLAIVPASEIWALKSKSVDQARKDLGVNLVLEGSLRASGDTLAITWSLVDARTRRALRAETATLQSTDPFSIEDRVVQGALRMLEVNINPGAKLTAPGTAVSSAYGYYLEGLGRLRNFNVPENLERAIGDFSRALALDPNYALAYAGLGQANWKKFETSKETEFVELARQNCQRAAELDPQAAPAHVCLGLVSSGTGRSQDAVREFERALQIDPRSDAAYRGMAEAYARLSKNEDAEKTYLQAIKMNPQYWVGHSALGVLYANQARYDEAVEQFRIATALAPENARPYFSLGGAFTMAGRYEEATAALTRSLELRPWPAAYSNLGYVNFRLRRFDEAIAAYQQAIAVSNLDYRVSGNLAETYYWAPGQRSKSREVFRRAIDMAEQQLKINPQDWYTHSMLAKYYAYLGDASQARDHLQRALAGRPQDPAIQYRAAVVQNVLGDRNGALQALQKAVAAGHPRSDISAAREFDNLRQEPRFAALLRK